MNTGACWAAARIGRIVGSLCCSLSLLAAGDEGPSGLAALEQAARWREWDRALQELAALEQAGPCAGAFCLVARAVILSGQGHVQEARVPAREAIAKLDADPPLSSWWYNELGVVLYQGAGGNAGDLKMAEVALRKGVAVHTQRACNVKYNLAKVLKALGRVEESTKIMAELKVDGMLVDQQMSILGTLQAPGRP